MTATEQQLRDWGFVYNGKVDGGAGTSIWNRYKNDISLEAYISQSGNILGVYLGSAPAPNCTSLPSLYVLLHLFDMI